VYNSVSPKLQVFVAVSGRDGSLLWTFDAQKVKNGVMNVYTPHYIQDMDRDGTVDILVIHGGDPVRDPGNYTLHTGHGP
jgi:hypothetical protein